MSDKGTDPQNEPQGSKGSNNESRNAQDNNDMQQSEISQADEIVEVDDIEIADNSPDDKQFDSQKKLIAHSQSDAKKNTNYSIIEENKEDQSPQLNNIVPSNRSSDASNINAINPSQVGPSYSQMKRAIIFFDNAFIYEKILLQMKSVLFRISTLEFLCFFFNILWFARQSSHIWYNVFYLFHVARSIFGLQISSRLPWSHQMIDDMNLKGNQQEQLKLEDGHKMFAAQLKKQIVNIVDQVRLLTRLYMLFTVICLVLDLISWFVWFGSVVWDLNTLEEYNIVTTDISYTTWQNSDSTSEEAKKIISAAQLYPEFMFFVLTSVYIAFDLYYPLWVIHQKTRMPNLFREFDSALVKAMLGNPNDLLLFYQIDPAPAANQAQARQQKDKKQGGNSNKPQKAASINKQNSNTGIQRKSTGGSGAARNQNIKGVR